MMPPSSRRPGRTRSRLQPPRQDDDGFVLLESIISISLITVIMAALAMLFVTVIKVNNQQRARQAAVQVADTAVGQVRALQPSDLVPGRTSLAVSSQWAAAPALVTPWLSSMSQATDSSVATPALPVAATTQTVNNIPFSVNTYLGWCWLNPTTTSSDCTASSSPGSVKFLRAVVAVTWSDTHCPVASATDSTPTCVYVTSTMVSTAPDPIFNLNEAPPALPIIVNPGSQTSFAVGDTVNLQMQVQSGTGVPTYTWLVSAGALPSGLSMNPAGLISGTITGTSGTVSTSVQVTDGFARNAVTPATFSWTVLPPLTIADPSPQASVSGAAITPLTISASGGSGTPYTWSDPGNTLPPGLTLTTVSNKASISGTPTSPSSTPYSVTLKVKDSTNTRSDTTTFLWTVKYPPMALSSPGNQTDTLNTVSPGLQLSAAGGDGSYSWTAGATLPAGLTLSQSGLISGTATALGAKAVTVTVTDGQGTSTSVSLTWTVVAAPTVTAPAPATTSVGSSASLAVTSSCPNAPCSYTISGQPTGLTITSGGVISGTVGGAATTYSGIVITIKDADGATSTSAAFTWTVVAAPTVGAPPSQVNTTSGVVSLQLGTTCALGGCTYTLNSGPSGLSISNTGKITGTIGSAAGSNFGSASVTVRDAGGSAMTSSTFSWTITAPPTVTAPVNLTSRVGSGVGVSLVSTCPHSPCSYVLLSGPTGVSIDANGIMSGPITGTASTVYSGAKVKITDADNIAATSSAFRWTIGTASTIGGTWPINTTQSATPQQTISYTCTPVSPATTCTISLSGGPSGIGLSATSGNATANAVSTLSVNSGSGTVYLNGKVASNATKKTYTVVVSITGTAAGAGSDTGSWVVA